MKTIVIYNSKTGFTKRYAEWISEALSCECVELKEASKKAASISGESSKELYNNYLQNK